MRKEKNTPPTPVEEFKEEYKMHPRLMYWIFRLYGMRRNHASRAVNLLWDDCDHSSDFELLDRNPLAYHERAHRWNERAKLYLSRG